MQDDKRYLEAIHFFNISRYEQSNSILLSLLMENPQDDSLMHMLGLNYYFLHDYSNAINYAYMSLENGGTESDNQYLLAISYHAEKKYIEAEKYYLETLHIVPTHAAAMAQYGSLMMVTGHEVKGEKLLQEAKRLEPENQVVLSTWFKYYDAIDENVAYENTLGDMISVGDDEKVNLIRIMQFKTHEKKYKEAFEICKEAFLMDPTDDKLLKALRELEIAAHPLMCPMRWIERIGGPWKIWLVAIVLIVLLGKMGFDKASMGLIIFYLCLSVYSWIIEPILRGYYSVFKKI